MAGGESFRRLTTRGGVTYQPGLDGLRGLAVAAVVAFHLDLGVVGGGYLGVSLFFTLSGVLIGTLVLHELATGRFSLPRFWSRRARRLLPAALLTLAVVAVSRLFTSDLEATSGGDLAAATFNVANWHFLAAGASYADLFQGPSAVLHFWSLAIEEQFYAVVGLLAALLAVVRPRRPVLVVGAGAAALAAASFAVPLILGLGVDRTYYGTDTRAGELMIGVAVAAVIAAPRRRDALLRRVRPLAALAVGAAAGTVALWLVATPGSGAIPRGLLPLTAGLSVLVIVGALLPGPVGAIARARPLRALGRISYGVYLVHWPVLVVANRVTADRSLGRAVVIAAVSVGLAYVSAVAVERPVRAGRLGARPVALAGAAVVVVASIGVAASLGGRRSASAQLVASLDRAAVSASAELVAGRDATAPAAAAHTTSPDDAAAPLVAPAADASRLPRVALFGDSVGFSMLLSLGAATTPADYVRAPSDVNIGCGIALSPSPPPDQPGVCDDPARRFAAKAADGEVDVAVMISCQWELVAQAVPGDARVRTAGDAEFDSFVEAAYAEVADGLAASGVERILWMRCPYLSQSVGVDGLSPRLLDSRDPARVDALNRIIDRLAADRDDVEVFPFDEWVNARTDDATIRPDGSHFDFKTPNQAADAFVALLNGMLSPASLTASGS